MIPQADLLMFALAALIMGLTPGPNMVYQVSRSLCQGRKAGVISLFGVVAGLLVHLLVAAAGRPPGSLFAQNPLWLALQLDYGIRPGGADRPAGTRGAAHLMAAIDQPGRL